MILTFLELLGLTLLLLTIPFLHYLTGKLIFKILSFLALAIPFSALVIIVYMAINEQTTNFKKEVKFIMLPLIFLTLSVGLYWTFKKRKGVKSKLSKNIIDSEAY